MVLNRVNELTTGLEIRVRRKEPPGDFLGKALFLVVRVVDWEGESGFAQAVEFDVGVCLDHHCCPGFEAKRGEAWDVGLEIEMTCFLHQVVLACEFAIHAGDR